MQYHAESTPVSKHDEVTTSADFVYQVCYLGLNLMINASTVNDKQTREIVTQYISQYLKKSLEHISIDMKYIMQNTAS